MKATRRRKSAETLRRELQIAIWERREHANDCPFWDYGENSCAACSQYDERVKALRRRWHAARDAET